MFYKRSALLESIELNYGIDFITIKMASKETVYVSPGTKMYLLRKSMEAL